MHSHGAPAAASWSAVRAFLADTFVGSAASRLSAGRGRTAVLNQLLLCALVLVVSLVTQVVGPPSEDALLLAGALIVFAAGGVTLLVPWARVPRGGVFLVPLVDVLAIAMMSHAEPGGGLGLLLIFPAIWLASLGIAGFVLQFVVITATYAAMLALDGTGVPSLSSLLLPIVILAVATTSFVSTRRYLAQQALLDKQAALLSGALHRARRQEELMVEVLDAVDFGVLRIAPDGTVAVVNEALGRFQQSIPGFGSRDRELDHVYRADGTTRLPHEERPLVRAVRGEVFDNQVVWFGHPDERRHALSITVRRMRDALGADAGAVLIARDITSETAALRARDRLVASVSHELRTPLTSVLGYIDLAIDGLDDPAQARASLEIAARNGERLLEIVADILAASSASRLSVDMTISPESTDLAELVRLAAEAWRARAAVRAITIDTSGIEAARAFVDPLRMRQVVDNLISNAVKFNRDGGQIALGCTTDGVSSWILVRDSGPGIPEADAGRLFERFFRARPDVEGTGLGLSISRDIVRAHAGDITVRSSRGVGSTFMVQLPADADAADRSRATPVPEAS